MSFNAEYVDLYYYRLSLCQYCIKVLIHQVALWQEINGGDFSV